MSKSTEKRNFGGITIEIPCQRSTKQDESITNPRDRSFHMDRGRLVCNGCGGKYPNLVLFENHSHENNVLEQDDGIIKISGPKPKHKTFGNMSENEMMEAFGKIPELKHCWYDHGKFICCFCGKSYPNPYTLFGHIIIHPSNSRPVVRMLSKHKAADKDDSSSKKNVKKNETSEMDGTEAVEVFEKTSNYDLVYMPCSSKNPLTEAGTSSTDIEKNEKIKIDKDRIEEENKGTSAFETESEGTDTCESESEDTDVREEESEGNDISEKPSQGTDTYDRESKGTDTCETLAVASQMCNRTTNTVSRIEDRVHDGKKCFRIKDRVHESKKSFRSQTKTVVVVTPETVGKVNLSSPKEKGLVITDLDEQAKNKAFSTLPGLENCKSSNGHFFCDLCTRWFNNPYLLFSHRLRHKTENGTDMGEAKKRKVEFYKLPGSEKSEFVGGCDICHQSFSSPYLLYTHKQTSHLKADEKEDEVSQEAAVGNLFGENAVSNCRMHNGSFYCNLCRTSFKNPYLLLNHQLTHMMKEKNPTSWTESQGDDVPASDIPESVKSESTPDESYPSDEGITFECNACQLIFTSLQSLADHVETHAQEEGLLLSCAEDSEAFDGAGKAPKRKSSENCEDTHPFKVVKTEPGLVATEQTVVQIKKESGIPEHIQCEADRVTNEVISKNQGTVVMDINIQNIKQEKKDT